MDEDLTAAVARLRDSTHGIGGQLSNDIRRVLSALESAQQDTRTAMNALREIARISDALAAIDAATGEEK